MKFIKVVLLVAAMLVCDAIGKTVPPTEASHSVRVTYYNPDPRQCFGDPLVTADGSKISLSKLKQGKLKWIAISRDLKRIYPLGSRVKVVSEKYPKISGTYEVHDVMGPRARSSIDILLHKSHGHLFPVHNAIIRKAAL
jgi:3D (Asp-Asp-Asp) domain-containing protein